jgi:hypothetical protein
MARQEKMALFKTTGIITVMKLYPSQALYVGNDMYQDVFGAQWIGRVSWDESKVFVNLPREAIKKSPEYREESLPTRDYETGLHRHYNRQGYWVDEEPLAKEHSR